MNMDQMFSLVRQILPVVGGIMVALGWLPETLITTIKANMENILAALSALIIAGSAIWATIVHTKTATIAAATKLEEVNSMKFAQAIDDPELKKAAQNATA